MTTSDEVTRVAWLARSLSSSGRGATPAFPGLVVESSAADGDDCAILGIDEPMEIVFGMDYVRGPKFMLYEKGFLSNRDIGRFCVTANMSDVAAMGAKGIGFLSVVRYPSEFTDEDFQEVMGGIDDACAAYDVRLLGGDTGSAERLILSGAGIGVCPRGYSLRRDVAQPSDVVAVTRPVGGAGAAVLAAARDIVPKLAPSTWDTLLSYWQLPIAQMGVGETLTGTRRRIACQDVSDGVKATLAELGRRSGVAITLDLDAVPIADGVREVADALSRSAVDLAISTSTDFCLCFACGADDYPIIEAALAKRGETSYVIGRCEAGEGVWVQTDAGVAEAPGGQWNHQGDLADVILDGLKKSGG